jgi:hypothetical protein
MESGCLAVSFCIEIYASGVVCTPCKVLIVVPITSFLYSARGLEFLLFDRDAGALLQSQWGVLGLCALWGISILAPAE